MEKSGSYKTKFGPGWWDYVHRLAAKEIRNCPEDWDFFIKVLESYPKCFGCSECCNHFRNMLENKYKKKIPHYKKMKIEQTREGIGAYVMSVDMHNEVNNRLRKPIIRAEDLLELYLYTGGVPEEDSKMKKINNEVFYKTKFGPGWWDYLHRLAAKTIKTDDDWDFFLQILDSYSKCFGSSDCCVDFQQLVEEHKERIPYYKRMKIEQTGEKIGAYVMSVDIHNRINEKLRKPIVRPEDLLEFYLTTGGIADDGTPCMELCG